MSYLNKNIVSKLNLGKNLNSAANKCTECGDSINVSTGVFSVRATDLLVQDRGLDMEIKRTYSSRNTVIGIMGRGWTFEYESCLEIINEGSTIKVLYPEGHSKNFIKTEIGYINQDSEDESEVLREIISGDENYGYSLNIKNKTIYEYNKNGKLTAVKDRNNNKI